MTNIVSPLSSAGAAQINKSRTVAFATVTFDELSQNVPLSVANKLVSTARSADSADLRVAVGGQVAELTNKISVGGLPLGVLAAGIVLLIVFGSVLAMALPLISALASLGIATGLIELLSHVLKMPQFASELTVLIGLGVGVDYALFIVTRHRQGLIAGHDKEVSIVNAVNTSGRAVLFAGIIVCIALLGMFALGVSYLYGLAIAASTRRSVDDDRRADVASRSPRFYRAEGALAPSAQEPEHRRSTGRRRERIWQFLVALGQHRQPSPRRPRVGSARGDHRDRLTVLLDAIGFVGPRQRPCGYHHAPGLRHAQPGLRTWI